MIIDGIVSLPLHGWPKLHAFLLVTEVCYKSLQTSPVTHQVGARPTFLPTWDANSS